MDPPVYSTIAKKYGLDTSLLERLYYDESYTRGKGLVCKIQLTDNHRSHADVRNFIIIIYTCVYSSAGNRYIHQYRLIINNIRGSN